jgi:hypothetical protein
LILLALLFFFTITSLLSAHPLTQANLDVTVNPDRIVVHARVSSEEVSITNSTTGDNPLPGPWAAQGANAFEQHAKYLAAHLHITSDDKPLAGRVLSVTPPDDASADSKSSAVYDIEYPLPATSPHVITLWQDALADARLGPGQSWTTLYLVNMSQAGHAPAQQLLARKTPMTFICDWSPAGPANQTAAQSQRLALFKSYCIHGINHILGEPTGPGIFPRSDIGFDHLLFVSALVLGAKSLWDLLKVVTAFTVAHTITLTLAATRMVQLHEHIAEPLIAFSIVFVAVQNVFWPGSSRGKLRFAAAFFFGLFHGLGFAGGLLDTMQQMHGATIALAIIAFSIGVELGHQFVVIPLFVLFKIARETRATEPAREKLRLGVERLGSAAISLAGLFYLVSDLKESFGM